MAVPEPLLTEFVVELRSWRVACPDDSVLSLIRIASFIVQPFYNPFRKIVVLKRDKVVCIKERQNISSGRLLSDPSNLKSPLAHV